MTMNRIIHGDGADSETGRGQSINLLARKPVTSSARSKATLSSEITPLSISSGTAQPLRKSRWWNILSGLVLLALCLPFFAFAGTAWRLRNTEVKDEVQRLRLVNFGNKLATAFPFVFALVVGNTLKQLASWRLERGTSVGFLEQMTGSLSVGGTIATQLLLRPINILAAVLILLWSLSPLGSQSCLQIFSIRRVLVDTGSNLSVAYFNTNLKPSFPLRYDISSVVNPVLAASLFVPATIRNANVDLWGNVKIPDLSRVRNSPKNPDGWFDIATDGVIFSSLIGIPLSGIPKEGNLTFYMDTSYNSVSCYPNISFPGTSADPNRFQNTTQFPEEDDPPEVLEANGIFYDAFYRRDEYTREATNPFDSSYIETTFTFEIAINQFYTDYLGRPLAEFQGDMHTYHPATLLFQSRAGGLVAYCPITTEYINSKVYCVSGSCSVIAIRDSLLPHPDSALTYLGFQSIFVNMTSALCYSQVNLAQYDKLELDIKLTPLEAFIADPDLNYIGQGNLVDMKGLTVDDVSIRLQQVLNTYMHGSIYTPALTGNTDLRKSDDSSEDVPKDIGIITTASGTSLQTLYTIDIPWICILFAATSIMALSALAGIWFSLNTRGPDLLGYFSTCLRDSPYVEPCSGSGTTLDGRERAKKFGKRRVRLVDVAGHKEEGYIAIAGDDLDVHGLVEGRYYQ
ncbi:hypothetical protein VTL71DRAFT_13824 [Oculimacula yallundae]|uniref:Peptidase A1 domain-containing protein n=1 Tax=Oculimacula yallundae TaxID=86028 RepID=A0ABR4CLI6_9HELO